MRRLHCPSYVGGSDQIYQSVDLVDGVPDISHLVGYSRGLRGRHGGCPAPAALHRGDAVGTLGHRLAREPPPLTPLAQRVLAAQPLEGGLHARRAILAGAARGRPGRLMPPAEAFGPRDGAAWTGLALAGAEGEDGAALESHAACFSVSLVRQGPEYLLDKYSVVGSQLTTC